MIDTIEKMIKSGVELSDDKLQIKGCSNPENIIGVVRIPSTIKDFSLVGKGFRGCKNLVDIELPNGFRSIHDDSFNGCTSLTKIVIPNTVEYIGRDSFKGCTSLSYIYIPKSATRINCPFTGINIYIEVDEDNPEYSSIEGSLYSKDQKRLIKYCSKRFEDKIEIGGTVESIEDYAFSGCNLLSDVIINESVKHIGIHIFENCYSLKKFICQNIYLPFPIIHFLVVYH